MNTRWMIDTNIFLDVFLQREGFFEASKGVLKLCEDRRVQGVLSASSITDIFNIVKKGLRSTEMAYSVLGSILNIVKVASVSNEDVMRAFMTKASDFEDCLLATCAKTNQCTAIVTRNKKDFLNFGIPLLSPEEVMEEYPALR